MIESIFKREYTGALHNNAPFLKEREAYLWHLQASGRRNQYLQKTATAMLHIIRVLQLGELRNISKAEIESVARQWASEVTWQRSLRGRRSSAYWFTCCAQRWLTFQEIFVTPKEHFWFDSQLADFRKGIELNGLRAVTCIHVWYKVRQFFRWLGSKRTSVQAIRVSDIDDYVDKRLQTNLSPRSIDSDYRALQLFFRYAEAQCWCARGFSYGLKSPSRRKRTSEGSGPTWREVGRLIGSCNHETPSDLRAKVILLLCSVYGLRNGKVTRLRLNDLDWQKEIITVTRSKSGRVQRFPIQYEVGEAIINYLRLARPETTCRQLFMTTNPPYRQLRTLWPIISRRMRKQNIDSKNVGPHALRHACATELLRKGASLREIADFLGHRNLSSVGI